MDINLMRLAWSAVESTPLPQGRCLSLGEQISEILLEIENRAALSPQELQQIRQYLFSRQHLLTDLYQ